MRSLFSACAGLACCALMAAASPAPRDTNTPVAVTNAVAPAAGEDAELDLLQSLLGVVSGDTNAVAAIDGNTLSNLFQKTDLKQALATLLEVNDQIHDSGPHVPASSTRHMTRLFNMQLPVLLLMVIPILVLVVRFLFAVAILSDAQKMREKGRRFVFIGPTLWVLATLAGGLMVVALYWLVHHSKLRRDVDHGKDGAYARPDGQR